MVQTPAVMPVGTVGFVKGVSNEEFQFLVRVIAKGAGLRHVVRRMHERFHKPVVKSVSAVRSFGRQCKILFLVKQPKCLLPDLVAKPVAVAER